MTDPLGMQLPLTQTRAQGIFTLIQRISYHTISYNGIKKVEAITKKTINIIMLRTVFRYDVTIMIAGKFYDDTRSYKKSYERTILKFCPKFDTAAYLSH